MLAAAGYRVVVPFLRGFGTTRFLSEATLRNGDQAAFALDVIAMLDALGIDRTVLAGFDTYRRDFVEPPGTCRSTIRSRSTTTTWSGMPSATATGPPCTSSTSKGRSGTIASAKATTDDPNGCCSDC